MEWIVNLEIIENLDSVELTLTDGNGDTNIVAIDSDEIVNVTIQEGRDGRDGVNGQNGQNGQNGIDGDSITVNSIAAVSGNITLETSDIPESAVDYKYVTDAEKVVISNTSGTNTGDNSPNSLYSGLAASKEDVANKSTSVVTDQASDVKYPSVKSVYDWVVGLLGSYLTSATAASTYEPIFSKNTAFNKNFGTSAGTVAEGNTVALKTIQVTSQTLLAANWTLVSGLYEYDLANVNITALNFVEVIPDNATIAVTKAAELLPTNVSSVGSVKIYATNLPTGNIVVTINIYE